VVSVFRPDPADLQAVEAIVRAAGTSFYRGMAVLPPDRRNAMYAVYAFCRIVDDIADEEGTIEEKRAGLAAWRGYVAGLRQGTAHDPVTRVLVQAVAAFDLREQDFLDVIDGMQMDAETVIVAPDLATLDLYCDRVASAVGRLSVRAFGDSSPAADRVAHALGRALQLTNILRDIKEDADRGRVYLPREFLVDAGVPLTPEGVLSSPALPAACARLAAVARGHFADAHTAMSLCNPAAMKPARLMGATYAAILTALERAGWRDLSRRVGLSTWTKLWILLRHGLR
jgi:presqualene diphosphate synthase